jgi:hypothetical protein
MDFRNFSLHSHTTLNIAFSCLSMAMPVFSAQAEALAPQIEIQAYIDPSLYEMFGDKATTLVNDSLTYAELNLRRALNIKSILAPAIPATLMDNKYKSGLDEMNAFAKSIAESTNFNSADIHVLFSMPRANSWAFGISYQNSICSSEQRNILLVRLSSPALTALTLTHEIGHMLGAEHETDTNNIMNPLFGIPWPEYFSNLGVQSIKAHLKNVGHCLLWNTGTRQTIRTIRLGVDRVKLLWNRNRKNLTCRLKQHKLVDQFGIASKLSRIQSVAPRIRQKLVKFNSLFKINRPTAVWSLDCGENSEQRSRRI